MSNSNKNPWEEEIDLSVYDEIDDYISRKIQEVLETKYIFENQSHEISREIFEKQFDNDLECMRNLYEKFLKEKCTEMGIDPESLFVDWKSLKVGEEP